MPNFAAALRNRIARSPEAGAGTGFLAVFLFFALITPHTFLTNSSFSSILNSQAVPGMVAIGITLLMISGEFDLSVGSILGVSSLAFLHAVVGGVHIILAGCIGLTVGAVLGLLNGLALIWTGIPSFIVTLGTMLVYRAISLTAISGGRIIRYADFSRESPTVSPPAWLILLCALLLLGLSLWAARDMLHSRHQTSRRRLALGLGFALLAVGCTAYLAFFAIAACIPSPAAHIPIDIFAVLNGRIKTISGHYRAGIVWWFALTLIFAIVLTKTPFGNAVFATGGNAEAARLQGIHINRIRVTNFVLSGVLAAFAGIVQVARLKSVDPLRGTGMELEIIAAVVIGGTLLTGGYGSLVGSAIGTTLTGMLRTGLVLIQVPSNAFRGAIGAIMIIAVVINNLVRRGR